MQEAAVPAHIGFILDGNRRWARERGLPSMKGHLEGYKAFKEVAIETIEQGVKVVSAYIFSTENWKRTEEEVSYLMRLTLRIAEKEVDELVRRGIRVRFLGGSERLSKKIVNTLRSCEEKSAHCTKGTLAICFNYGGKEEIAHALRAIIRRGASAEEVTPELIGNHLYHADLPDLDLVVRTSGEQRLSNFMLWRAAYAEFLFLDKNWPEMTKKDVKEILLKYAERQRRFGGN